MEKPAKAYSFLISALITLLGFILMIAIAMTLFAASASLSYTSENKTIAVNLAQEEMERIKESFIDLDSLAEDYGNQLAVGPIEEQKTILHPWNGKEREFEVTSRIFFEELTKGKLVTIEVDVKGWKINKEQEMLIGLETQKYVG